MSRRHDPAYVAYLCRWARSHWQNDHSQPADLDDLLLRASETLEKAVPRIWRRLALVQAAFFLLMLGWHLSGGSAHARAIYAEDSFVHMIERQLSASTHLSIGPGVTMTIPDCSCTVRYVGTRKDGMHYHVDIDKLD